MKLTLNAYEIQVKRFMIHKVTIGSTVLYLLRFFVEKRHDSKFNFPHLRWRSSLLKVRGSLDSHCTWAARVSKLFDNSSTSAPKVRGPSNETFTQGEQFCKCDPLSPNVNTIRQARLRGTASNTRRLSRSMAETKHRRWSRAYLVCHVDTRGVQNFFLFLILRVFFLVDLGLTAVNVHRPECLTMRNGVLQSRCKCLRQKLHAFFARRVHVRNNHEPASHGSDPRSLFAESSVGIEGARHTGKQPSRTWPLVEIGS